MKWKVKSKNIRRLKFNEFYIDIDIEKKDIGNQHWFLTCLGLSIFSMDLGTSDEDDAKFRAMIEVYGVLNYEESKMNNMKLRIYKLIHDQKIKEND